MPVRFDSSACDGEFNSGSAAAYCLHVFHFCIKSDAGFFPGYPLFLWHLPIGCDALVRNRSDFSRRGTLITHRIASTFSQAPVSEQFNKVDF
jgi:hypothetical protein